MPPVRQQMSQMVQHAPAGGHPGRGHDQRRLKRVVGLHRFRHRAQLRQLPRIEGLRAVGEGFRAEFGGAGGDGLLVDGERGQRDAVPPVAIGGFDEQHVGSGEGLWRAQ
jgi:hypothetical protein